MLRPRGAAAWSGTLKWVGLKHPEQITLTQAQQLAALIEARRQLLQTEEFETRLGILEKTSSPT